VGKVSLSVLKEELPKIIADALTCGNPDGILRPHEIELEIEMMPAITQSKYQLQITIDANDYPERRVNLDDRRIAITRCVRDLFDGCGFLPIGFVWVRLFPASFGEF
jgi:hypothetical protein